MTDRERWATWLSTLSPEARAAIDHGSLVSEETQAVLEFGRWLSTLSEPARAICARKAPVVETHDVSETHLPRFGVVSCMDGELPVIKIYSTVDLVARRLGELEGQDSWAWAFYGVWLPFTEGPRRYLLVPSDGYALTIPTPQAPGVKRFALDLLGDKTKIQSDSYLGPDFLNRLPGRAPIEPTDFPPPRVDDVDFENNDPDDDEPDGSSVDS